MYTFLFIYFQYKGCFTVWRQSNPSSFPWNIRRARNGYFLSIWLALIYVICYSRQSNLETTTVSMFVILIVTNYDCWIIHLLSHCSLIYYWNIFMFVIFLLSHFHISLRITLRDKRLPLKIVRKQYPISVSFAMTINKSQGQSLSKVGLYLPRPVFTGKKQTRFEGCRLWSWW